MYKIVLSALVAALIVAAGFLVQGALADDQAGAPFFGGFKKHFAQSEMIEAKAEAAGLSVEEFKAQIEEQRLTDQAELLGISVSELEEALTNKNLNELITQLGLEPDELFAKRMALMKQRWQEQGLTEDEITAKEQFMTQQYEGCQYHCALGRGFGKGCVKITPSFGGVGKHGMPEPIISE